MEFPAIDRSLVFKSKCGFFRALGVAAGENEITVLDQPANGKAANTEKLTETHPSFPFTNTETTSGSIKPILSWGVSSVANEAVCIPVPVGAI